mmetsp:Transcript_18030/g.23515  ORF Transcript_18030/g.23515 Transcript_18030/m.23515 type:complete len:469 (-) Transcript_18030:345-1751(-)
MIKLLFFFLLAAIPYALLTLHYTTHLHSDTTVPGLRAAAADYSTEQKLESYWSVIHEAQRLLDSLNATTNEENGASLIEERGRGNILKRQKKTPLPVGNFEKSSGQIDLVLGLAKDIPTTNLAVFAASLRQHADSIEIVLFVDSSSVDAELKSVAQKYQMQLMVYNLDSLEPPWLRQYHASSFRWPLISAHLDSLEASKYRGVLFADVRDTAFQADPFALAFENNENIFLAFHGVEARTIGQCGWNGGWVKSCFGPQKLSALSDKPILCSGISIASFELGRTYAKQMSAVISHQDFAKCERNGVDQGVHNVLIHENRIPHSKLIPQRQAIVANLQAKIAQIKSDNIVVRPSDQKPVAVVHQYDRFPQLANHYYATFGAQLFQSTTQDACQNFDLKPNVDLFKAKCDLSATSGTNVHDCCKACKKNPNCNGFTLAGSLCYLKTCKAPVTNFRMDGAYSGIVKRRRSLFR